jgi:hypothetical protein
MRRGADLIINSPAFIVISFEEVGRGLSEVEVRFVESSLNEV